MLLTAYRLLPKGVAGSTKNSRVHHKQPLLLKSARKSSPISRVRLIAHPLRMPPCWKEKSLGGLCLLWKRKKNKHIHKKFPERPTISTPLAALGLKWGVAEWHWEFLRQSQRTAPAKDHKSSSLTSRAELTWAACVPPGGQGNTSGCLCTLWKRKRKTINNNNANKIKILIWKYIRFFTF